MKSKIILLSVLSFLLLSQSALPQENLALPNPPTIDNTENLTPTLINFDDITFPDVNSIIISPNRYAGVSFYSPFLNNNTYLTWNRRYSQPNSLFVGYPVYNPGGGYYDIYSNDRTNVDFAQPAKDVAFLWGTEGYYSSGWVDIFDENNQLIISVPISFGTASWVSISLNQYSQRIKRLVLRRPSVSNNLFGHIFLDNFQFTPVTTSPPIGALDSVVTNGAVGAYGWSVDPDNTSASNFVDCYVDTVNPAGFLGRVTANNPSPDLPQYPGNHRFFVPIPDRYRDGNQHVMYCFGIDVTGGDSPAQLTGSPKTFRFNTPIGSLDVVDADGYAMGWSQDLDLPAQPNTVHFYIDGIYVGETVANLPRPDITPGNHGYRYYIPAQYRDNQQHTINAYGIDLTGDQNKLLQGSPKTFTLSPVVQTTSFISLPESPLTNNNNAGGGKRVFPDKITPNDTVNRSVVKVKAKLSAPTQGVNIYFKILDIDEPSTDSLPIDIGGNSNGIDNRGLGGNGVIYCSNSPLVVCPLSPNAVNYSTTDSNGEVIVYFSVSGASPGDNFAVVASTKETDVRQAAVYGLEIKDSVTNRTFQIGADRTEMLTVWRKLHIEIDSMGIVQNNLGVANPEEQTLVGNETISLPVRNFLDSGRFESGRMLVDNDFLEVSGNTSNALKTYSPFYPIMVFPQNYYTLYDDDDFNSDNWIGGFDADNGEDITALGDSFNLMQENDDTNCNDGLCNVFAAAYIEPEYSWANPYNTSDISFVQNIPNTTTALEYQIGLGRNSNSSESDDFWVVYLQTSYQSGLETDCDSDEERCRAGGTPGSVFFVDFIRNEEHVPTGSQGSLVFIEIMKDTGSPLSYRIKTSPHEIGHQFGIAGDDTIPNVDFGLMGGGNGLTFIEEHLNVIRWRRKSPGVPRN